MSNTIYPPGESFSPSHEPPWPREPEQPPEFGGFRPHRPDEREPEARESGEDHFETIERSITELRQQEEESLNERYGQGFVEKARHWLSNTKLGKAIKIGGKVIAGGAAAFAASHLSGDLGLLAAPMLYTLGLKSAIDGGIEVVQELAGGRNQRLQLEAARQDFLLENEAKMAELRQSYEAGEIPEEEYEVYCTAYARDLANAEQAVLDQEIELAQHESKQKLVRGLSSTVLSLGIGMLQGVPLGEQDFDRDGVTHAVTYMQHGFEYLYSTAERVGSATSHALGHLPPVAGTMVGLGSAVIGLTLKTAQEIRNAFQRGEINEPTPRMIEVLPEEMNIETNEQVSHPAVSEPTARFEPSPPEVIQPHLSPAGATERYRVNKDLIYPLGKIVIPEIFLYLKLVDSEKEEFDPNYVRQRINMGLRAIARGTQNETASDLRDILTRIENQLATREASTQDLENLDQSFRVKFNELTNYLNDNFNITVRESPQDSAYNNETQEIHGYIETDDPAKDNMVAQSHRVGMVLNNWERVLPSGSVERYSEYPVAREEVLLYRYRQS